MKKLYMVLVTTTFLMFLSTATAFYYTPMPLVEKNRVFLTRGRPP